MLTVTQGEKVTSNLMFYHVCSNINICRFNRNVINAKYTHKYMMNEVQHIFMTRQAETFNLK